MMEDTECARTMYKYKDCVHIPVLTFVDDAMTVSECGPNSVKMNAYMQSKVETKKLKLGETKCKNMHIGNNQIACPKLKVHGQEMQTSDREKYLGDVITSSAKIDENVQMRHDKGIGISNQIMSTLKEVSFGVFHFEMGLLFRTTQLINGILFNTEALFSITEKHILLLEDCDKYLMRSLFNAEMGTPIESFFIETSTIPIRFIIQARRIMFYWTMLRKNKEELAKRVFLAMKEFPDKTDWYSQVKKDLTECCIEETEDEIKAMSEYKLKNLLREKIKENSQDYLTTLQVKHSKSLYLHQGPKMQEYLYCSQLTIKQKQLLFKLRSGVTPNKANFKTKYQNDLSCILCKRAGTVENLQHLLSCTFLMNQTQLKRDIEVIKCNDIDGSLES